MISNKLNNKIVVITGGSGLLGSKFCESVFLNGGIPINADIDEEKSFDLVKHLNKKHSTDIFDAKKLDINSENSIEDLICYLQNKYNRIDALVNNAYPRNSSYGNIFFDVKYEDFLENINLNIGGFFLTSKIFAKFFIDQDFGNIINISSIYGVVPPKFKIYQDTDMTMPVEYSIIKSSMIHFTKYLASYLSGKNIRVNAISPGGILDNQDPLFISAYNNECLSKGLLDPEDICNTLIFLINDASSYINGQNIIVDDGFSLS